MLGVESSIGKEDHAKKEKNEKKIIEAVTKME